MAKSNQTYLFAILNVVKKVDRKLDEVILQLSEKDKKDSMFVPGTGEVKTIEDIKTIKKNEDRILKNQRK